MGTILDNKIVPKLNPSIPEEARRIQQRKRVVAYGKNTVGYDEYMKQVPKHERKLRTLEHPTTPDAEADIPNKRWLGLVKAWRRALHKYDPPEMKEMMLVPTHKPITLEGSDLLLLPRKPSRILTKQEQQIHDATIQGLPVEFSNAVTVSEDNQISDDGARSDNDIDMNNESFLSCRWADVCDSDDDLL